MVTPKARRSSRKRNASHIGKKPSNTPAFVLDENKNTSPANRKAKRLLFSMERKAFGAPNRLEFKQKRKDRQKKARQVLRQIRNETQKAMRG